MSVFAITFRVEKDTDYDRRYNSMVEVIEKEAGSKFWDETTSFYVLNNSRTAQDLCDRIYYDSAMNESKDMLVVINLSVKAYSQRGVKYPNTLASFLDHR